MEEIITKSISKDNLRAIFYDLIAADVNFGVREHPQKQMRELGIHLIKAVPESIADGWWCLTDYQGELPPYIKEKELKPHDWYWKHWGIDLVE